MSKKHTDHFLYKYLKYIFEKLQKHVAPALLRAFRKINVYNLTAGCHCMGLLYNPLKQPENAVIKYDTVDD